MLFNSLNYVVFLAVALACYYARRHRWQNILLLAASYFFYACWDRRFLSLILITTLVDYRSGLSIHEVHEAKSERARRAYLWAKISN